MPPSDDPVLPRRRAPASIIATSVFLWVWSALTFAAVNVLRLSAFQSSALIGFAVLYLVLGVVVITGRNWARITTNIVVALNLVGGLVEVVKAGGNPWGVLALTPLMVLLVLVNTTKAVDYLHGY